MPLLNWPRYRNVDDKILHFATGAVRACDHRERTRLAATWSSISRESQAGKCFTKLVFRFNRSTRPYHEVARSNCEPRWLLKWTLELIMALQPRPIHGYVATGTC